MESWRALTVTTLLLAAALPLGATTLRLLRFRATDFAGRLDLVAIALAVGLGTQALILTLLGLGQMLYPPIAIAAPLALGILAAPPALPLWQPRRLATPGGPATSCTGRPLRLGGAVRFRGPESEARGHRSSRVALAPGADSLDGPVGADEAASPRPSSNPEWWFRLATVISLAIVATAVLIQDLAPPTDYDGLLYHLVAPREFLAAHAIVYVPHNFSANLPAFGEMLYAFGLAAASDRMAQLLHGIAGALCILLTYCLGRATLGHQAAFWGSALLAATPLIPFLATRAYIDLLTLLFSLLALQAFANWLRRKAARWLVLAGAGAGAALATKYAAATLVLVLGASILIVGWRAAPGRGLIRRLRSLCAPAIWFGAAAAAIAMPWYARQIVALANPVWPVYFGGRDWDAARVEQLTYFVSQYGTGRGLSDWLQLPLNVYRQSWRFGHVPDSYPPVLAPFAPLALAVPGAAAPWLLAVTAGLALLWTRGWQDLRFLLPVYPLLAIVGAFGVLALGTRVGRPRAARYVLAVSVSVAAIWAAGSEIIRAADALGVVSGREPEAAYLRRKLPDQRAIELLNEQAAPGSAALFLGDGQIWYCRQRCFPDAAHDNLLMWFVRPGDPERALAALRREGVSHILLSKRDYWYLEHQDPERRLQRHLAVFYAFKARHLDLIYEDELAELYRGRW